MGHSGKSGVQGARFQGSGIRSGTSGGPQTRGRREAFEGNEEAAQGPTYSRRLKPTKLTRGNCGSREMLVAACRKVSCRAAVAWRKRNLSRKIRVGFVQCLSPNGAISSCPFFCGLCSLRSAIPVERVILLPAVANSFRGPPFPWVRIFLERFLFRHATAARQNTFLQAATNISRDPQFPRVSFVGFTRRPAAIRWPLGRFFVTLEGFSATSCLGTSRRSTSDSTSLGPCSLHSILATVAHSLGMSCGSMTFSLRSWMFLSRSDRLEWTMASIFSGLTSVITWQATVSFVHALELASVLSSHRALVLTRMASVSA
jgi:hypothetical protein